MYTVSALLAIEVVGFIVEGVAGILESIVRRKWCKGKVFWKWYTGTTDEKTKECAQDRLWKSELAHNDFSRRRLRILVTRNTACCFIILTFFSISIVNYYVLATLLAISVLFFYLWVDARRGYQNDIESIGKLRS